MNSPWNSFSFRFVLLHFHLLPSFATHYSIFMRFANSHFTKRFTSTSYICCECTSVILCLFDLNFETAKAETLKFEKYKVLHIMTFPNNFSANSSSSKCIKFMRAARPVKIWLLCSQMIYKIGWSNERTPKTYITLTASRCCFASSYLHVKAVMWWFNGLCKFSTFYLAIYRTDGGLKGIGYLCLQLRRNIMGLLDNYDQVKCCA